MPRPFGRVYKTLQLSQAKSLRIRQIWSTIGTLSTVAPGVSTRPWREHSKYVTLHSCGIDSRSAVATINDHITADLDIVK